MPRKQSKARRKLVPWTRDDLKIMRQQAGKRSASQIGRALKRSVAAVRYKAHILKLSLDTR